MKRHFTLIILVLAAAFALAAPSPVAAQAPSPALPVHSAPVAASAEASRLRQMETIYQSQLRNKHIPQIGNYITELQRLAAQSPDPAPYRAEIERMQGILANGGVLDLSLTSHMLRAPADVPAPAPPPMPEMPKSGQGVMALTPALARSISPTPDSSSSPEAARAGEIEWRVEHLPAGTYDLVLSYACPELPAEPEIKVTLAGQRLSYVLEKNRLTRDANSYRLLRLGQIHLTTPARGESVKLTAGSATSPSLYLRQLLITRVRGGL